MASEEHLRILEKGPKPWNKWRDENPEITPDLYGANLHDARLNGANLRQADLRNANLLGAHLHKTDLREAYLRRALLGEVDLGESNLAGADLSDSILNAGYLVDANLSSVDLSGSRLLRVDLDGANLTGANLCGAFLNRAVFTGANLSGANLAQATVGDTVFANVDVREVLGLETVLHLGPSEVSVSTIYRSEGLIPEAFLRGCGLPESFIAQIPALVAAMQPIQFYSCFISYSSKDQKFAERLHADLQNKGVRCWYAPHDLKIGERIRVGIDESIRVHDKLLLILSKNSIESEWVEKEVEAAMERERQQKRTILFPIRLDDAALEVESGWAADVRRSRNIGDFRRWKNHDVYSKSFERLLRDLQASA